MSFVNPFLSDYFSHHYFVKYYAEVSEHALKQQKATMNIHRSRFIHNAISFLILLLLIIFVYQMIVIPTCYFLLYLTVQKYE